VESRVDYILRLLDQHKYLTPSLVAYYYRFPSGRNKVQQIMGRMAAEGHVNRFRVGRGEYIYHQGRRSAKWRHWLELARFHFALLEELKSWQRIIFWQNEVKYPFGVADGLYVVKTTLDSGLTFFLEVDDGNNVFDKVQKYRAYHAGRQWRREWWGADGFPLVLIVTPRAEAIRLMTGGDKMFRVMERPEGIIKACRRQPQPFT